MTWEGWDFGLAEKFKWVLRPIFRQKQKQSDRLELGKTESKL